MWIILRVERYPDINCRFGGKSTEGADWFPAPVDVLPDREIAGIYEGDIRYSSTADVHDRITSRSESCGTHSFLQRKDKPPRKRIRPISGGVTLLDVQVMRTL